MLTALVGGAVGFLLGALARALGIPGDVRTHQAAIADRDDQLASWIADRHYALQRKCQEVRAREPTASKATDQHVADARAAALHEYRDESRRARLDVATILASEGWAHRLYRRATRQGSPQLKSPECAEPLLDAWRRPSGMSGGSTVWPDDATQRTLEDAIKNLRASGP